MPSYPEHRTPFHFGLASYEAPYISFRHANSFSSNIPISPHQPPISSFHPLSPNTLILYRSRSILYLVPTRLYTPSVRLFLASLGLASRSFVPSLNSTSHGLALSTPSQITQLQAPPNLASTTINHVFTIHLKNAYLNHPPCSPRRWRLWPPSPEAEQPPWPCPPQASSAC